MCGDADRAGLSRQWSHDRAHQFFSRARWDPDELGLAVARLAVSLLVAAGEPVTVAVDDTPVPSAREEALPVMARLVVKGTTSSSRLWLARRMAAGRNRTARAVAVPSRSS